MFHKFHMHHPQSALSLPPTKPHPDPRQFNLHNFSILLLRLLITLSLWKRTQNLICLQPFIHVHFTTLAMKRKRGRKIEYVMRILHAIQCCNECLEPRDSLSVMIFPHHIISCIFIMYNSCILHFSHPS